MLRAKPKSLELRKLKAKRAKSTKRLRALATGKISRIPAIAKILLKRGSKPSTVAAMFERAVDGFVPHGEFEKEEVEKTVALLIL